MNNHLLPAAYKLRQDQVWYPDLYKKIAHWLYSLHGGQGGFCTNLSRSSSSFSSSTTLASPATHSKSPIPIRIVCISDTHNSTPQHVPDGDVLLHAGDLTRKGSFDELQTQLDWIASLPHRHKVVIAGNHDLLLDSKFGAADGRPGSLGVNESGTAQGRKKSKEDLDWKDIIYLQDSAVTLNVRASNETKDSDQVDEEVKSDERTLKIYGSPKVPECGTWAFQYLAVNDVWSGRLPGDVDIVMVHTPPALYCDETYSSSISSRVSRKGDGYLLQELRRVKPRLVVCGHLHDGYGQTALVHDEVCRLRELVLLERAGLLAVVMMSLWVVYFRLETLMYNLGKQVFMHYERVIDSDSSSPSSRLSASAATAPSPSDKTVIGTSIVNAAVSPGKKYDENKSAIVVNLSV